ncbi:MAG: hypothetical protein AAFV53_32160 [Myxococcota bacterium]
MAEDDYIIVARLQVVDEADRGVTGVARKLFGIERLGLRVGRSITSSLGRAFAALGGGLALRGAVRGMISLNSEIEQAEAGMATLLGGIANMPIGNAMQVARSQVAGLRKDAAEGVGELTDYTRAFQMLLGPGLTGGASMAQLRALTRTSLAAGFAQRGTAGLEQAPMDIVQALTSGINDRQTPIALSALKAINVEASAFNRLNMIDKIETLTRAFGAFDEGVAMMGLTWEAQTATLRDSVNELFRTATQPLFNRWSEQLRAANDWLSENQETLLELADRAGQTLVRLWDHLIERAGTYAAIVAGTTLLTQAPTIIRVGAQTGAGVRSIGARTSSFAAGLLGRGAGGGAIQAGTRLVGLLGRATIPLTIVTMSFMALYGALQEYPSLLVGMSGATNQLLGAVQQLRTSFMMLGAEGGLLGQLSMLWSMQIGSLNQVLNLAGASFYLQLTNFIKITTFAVRSMSTLILAMRWLNQLAGEFVMGVYRWNQGDEDAFSGTRDLFGKKLDKALMEIWKDPQIPKMVEPPDIPETADFPVGNNITNVNGPVNITIQTENMDDPARVATTIDEVLGRAQRNRTQARRGNGLAIPRT